MNSRSLWITIAWTVPASLASLTLLAEPKGKTDVSRTVEPLTVKLRDRIEVRLSRQLHESGIGIQEGADPDVVEAGYATAHPDKSGPWNDILQVARPDNPMVTEACRQRTRTRILRNASDRKVTLEHLKGQVERWDQVRQGARRLRLSEILLHMANCPLGCGSYLSGISSCHIEGIRGRERTIVYFDADRPREYEERYFVFDRRDERRIQDLARKALTADKNILLLSRASGANAFDTHNLSGNNAIAWSRARVVNNLLVAAGVPRDRILWKILSWETPRLAAGDVAEAYGFLDDWQSLPDKQAMDQSVVLVAY